MVEVLDVGTAFVPCVALRLLLAKRSHAIDSLAVDPNPFMYQSLLMPDQVTAVYERCMIIVDAALRQESHRSGGKSLFPQYPKRASQRIDSPSGFCIQRFTSLPLSLNWGNGPSHSLREGSAFRRAFGVATAFVRRCPFTDST